MVTVTVDAPPEHRAAPGKPGAAPPDHPLGQNGTRPPAPTSLRADDLVTLAVPENDEDLAEEISSLAGLIAVASCRLLVLIGEFDAREAWAAHGIMSCAHWLGWRCGIGPSSAREHIRVARALRGLPRTVEAFAAGRLSYSKVRAITRVATAANEADLVEIALCAPAHHLERLVRGLRTAQTTVPAANLRHARRHLSWRWAEDGSLLLSGRFSPEDGAMIVEALEDRRARARDEMAGAPPAPEPDANDTDPMSAPGSAGCPVLHPLIEDGRTLADALVELCAEEPVSDSAAPRTTRVVETAVHVTLADLTTNPIPAGASPDDHVLPHVGDQSPVDDQPSVDDQPPVNDRPAVSGQPAERRQPVSDPSSERSSDAARAPQSLAAGSLPEMPRLDGGQAITAATARRLACDGGIVVHVHENGVGVSGRTLEVGARTRRPHAALVRALWSRDRGCRYPGCHRRRFINAHHVIHWADGGPTTLPNMVLLCGTHHRLLHEGGFSLTMDPDGTLHVRDAHGRPVKAVPILMPGGAPPVAGPSDRWSLTPDWGGEPLHVDYATSVLLNLWAFPQPADDAAAMCESVTTDRKGRT